MTIQQIFFLMSMTGSTGWHVSQVTAGKAYVAKLIWMILKLADTVYAASHGMQTSRGPSVPNHKFVE
ncbi:hypothetical protein GJV26_13210 [Massilia dura]|uniref:Uncharacterized protein n=1 Tax=Pseudoduganella dura TaxID=321982 RepID=A0A6I3XJP2_9BURK|nr:hypothetical protein [Pseudoduganella dura]MUI13412.1 hypothetical protein [Pseudoduganella dura]